MAKFNGNREKQLGWAKFLLGQLKSGATMGGTGDQAQDDFFAATTKELNDTLAELGMTLDELENGSDDQEADVQSKINQVKSHLQSVITEADSQAGRLARKIADGGNLIDALNWYGDNVIDSAARRDHIAPLLDTINPMTRPAEILAATQDYYSELSVRLTRVVGSSHRDSEGVKGLLEVADRKAMAWALTEVQTVSNYIARLINR